ncbi:MAG: hypothetical protein IJ777_00360 [Clostridia bacterium]|nr:hypothetical protein [Clostridia bacterium]
MKEPVENKDICEINTGNYTNVLKAVHDNIDDYVGKKIKFSGYVYRMFDFQENQFVLARDMIISSDFQTVVVGFLCSCHEITNYENGTWVEIEGTITKVDYHGTMPMIQVQSIRTIEKPVDEYVYPPDESFVATSTIL